MKKEIKKFYPLDIQMFSGTTFTTSTVLPATSQLRIYFDTTAIPTSIDPGETATSVLVSDAGSNVISHVTSGVELGPEFWGSQFFINGTLVYETSGSAVNPGWQSTYGTDGYIDINTSAWTTEDLTISSVDTLATTYDLTYKDMIGVTYDSNGGSAVDFEALETGDLVTEPADPTKADNIFLGWYTEEALTNRFDFYNTTFTGTPFTLYAKWGSTSTDLEENASKLAYIGRAKEGLKEALTAKSVTMTGITDFAQYPRLIFSYSRSSTATAADILNTYTAYVNDEEVTGTMTNNADSDVDLTVLAGNTITEGYYDGTGTAKLSSTEAAKVISDNILSGVTLLGVSGAIDIPGINSTLETLTGV